MGEQKDSSADQIAARASRMLAELGDRIADLRDRKGWRQVTLARRAGLRPERLSRIVRRIEIARADEFVRLASVLGVSLDELAYGLRSEAAMSDPFEGLSALELKRLRSLTKTAYRLQHNLRLFAAKLPAAPEEAAREIVRSRLECVVNDYFPLVVQSLEAALHEADPEEET